MSQFDVFAELYTKLLELPPDELAAVLKNVLPPEELFQRMDGTLFVIRVHGLRIFETSALLEEAGIPADDPRARVFRELRGGLIDPQTPNALRAVAAREDTVCRNAGAVRVWIGGRRGWWVPIGATTKFKEALDDLIEEFADLRDTDLVARYADLYQDAEGRFTAAAESAWEDMDQLGRAAFGKEAYIQASLETFSQRFPTREEVAAKIRIVLEPRQRSLPSQVTGILKDLKEKQRQYLEAQVEAEKENARKIRIETEKEVEQLRMERLDRQIKEQELARLEGERKVREDLLREAISDEYERAQQIVLHIQSRLLVLAHEITDKAAKGGKVSSATKGSWRKTIMQLSALAPGNPDIEAALESLKQVAEKREKVSPHELRCAKNSVSMALKNIEQRTQTEFNADELWKLIAAGEGEEALRQLNQIRETAADNLSELDALYQLAIEIGAAEPE